MKHKIRFALASLSLAVIAATSFSVSFAAEPAKKLKVAIYQDTGSPEKGLNNVSKCLALMPEGFEYYKVDADDIRAGKLDGADVLVQPGGSGSAQAKALQPEGREIIKKFVREGHGYVGICAGAYLATNDYTWSLGFLNAKVVDKKNWARGPETNIKIHFTEEGQKELGVTEGQKDVIYHQGPILAPSTQPDMPAYTPLAIYDTEIVKKGAQAGLMTGATAIAAGEYGKGRVIAISPHPERSPGLDGVIRRAVQWTAGVPMQTADAK